jgi:UDP-2-acetamido-2,6-beta-L-arabino-hexul-4-ose reductase
MKSDARGSLFELIRSKQMGQIFISRSYKNITRGNHYHDSKVEKFCLIQGEAVIKLRNILSDEVISYTVSDKKVEVVDIPPGYTHSIENLGEGEMIVIFWSNQLFDPENPDTYYEKV